MTELDALHNIYSGRYNKDNLNPPLSRMYTDTGKLKPLKKSACAQISFKGFNFSTLFKPVVKKVPKRLTQKVFQSLKSVSKEQYEYYQKIREEYVNLVKTSASFRKRHQISEEAAKNISQETLYFIPKKNILNRFIESAALPFTAVGRGIKKLFTGKSSPAAQKIKEEEKILKDFTSLEGLIKSHHIWENGYRKMSGHGKWNENSEFLIPDDVLLSKIKRRRNKVVDPDKGKYSTTSLMLGNRFISGVVYSYFLGNDAYNTTMRYSNNQEEAKNQRKSRVAQEFSRIGLNMYIQNLLFGTFETAVNKSLPTALFVSGSTVAFSEILGRKLVGKPIMPSDKETLDRLEYEMEEKKGILPAIGRLLTRVKKPQAKKIKSTIIYDSKKNTSQQTFSTFAKKKAEKKSAEPSFKGYYSTAKMFDRKRLGELLKMFDYADKTQSDVIKEYIVKFVKNSKEFNMKLPDDIQLAFDKLIKSESIQEIPFGTQKTFWGQLTKSILVPVNFVKNLFVSAKNTVVNLYRRFTGKKAAAQVEKMNKTLDNPGFKHLEDFKRFYEQRLQLKVWKESGLSSEEKKVKIFSEYMEQLAKESEETEGIKNMLLWLDKQITKANIKIRKDGSLSAEDLNKVKTMMKESVLKADGAKHVEYDGNTLAQTNINLARTITTIFLVTDAYNLTMQYSNDNKKDAQKSAKNRAAQEVSRISLSAYILAFVHNLLSRMCNSSLAGAFGLTAITSVVNDSISRTIVGVPLTSKNQEQLKLLDEENANSKNPIRKALTYSSRTLKKKTAPLTQEECLSGKGLDGFFINPEIY